ncbi:hypothetical protein E3C22_19585 [Jiella endophytica]|uniref:TnsA endonuclease N-terminal domain-containing protein n=1 Tax=Jiella endophytica TaxID=2558362 RepID=A0A4Y8RCV5_9HYPH|nr:hypothetical protein [Jiella endophytica]TFF19868.1 hypothetical protein E3C22_19585 [Jiella endophytica]
MRASSFSLTGTYAGLGALNYGAESNLEVKNLLVAEADPDVVSMTIQKRLRYRDEEGRLRSHVFDLVKTLRSGIVVHDAVKPKAKHERSGIHAVIAAFRAQRQDRRAFFQVVDEDMLPDWRVANAVLTKKALDEPDPDADDRLFEALCTADGPLTVEEAGRRAGLGNRALAAAARLLRNREIALVGGRLLEICSAIVIAEQ